MGQDKSGLEEQEYADAVERAGTLDAVDPTVAKLIVRSGLTDGSSRDDPVKVSKGSWLAASLKPSQTSMVLPKAVGMALGMLASGKVGGDLGALVSSDGHILDGHHRWAATILASGAKGKVGGYRANLPGDKLLKVLNIVSKGLFNVRGGKAGKGSISKFTPSNVKDMLTDFSENGVGGGFPIPAAKVQAILERSFGSVEEGIEQMSENVKKLSKAVPAWAPDRKQMPVIDPRNVPKAVKVLNKGEINWKPPYTSREASAAIKLASSLPKGSEERRTLLSSLREARAYGKQAFDRNRFGRSLNKLISQYLEYAEPHEAEMVAIEFVHTLDEIDERARERRERSGY